MQRAKPLPSVILSPTLPLLITHTDNNPEEDPMKVNLEELSKLERRLNIEIPLEKVAKAFERIYQEFQKQATIKGFRKGKAPLDKIKSIYKDEARSNVLQDLVQEHFFQAIDQNNLKPIQQPRLKIHDLDEHKSFSFSADFEVHPEINLKNYENLSVKKELLDVDEKVIQQTLEKMQAQQAEFVPVFEDRPSQNGDVAVIDFEGFVDGQPLENAKGTQHNLELGSNQFIPGFEEGLLGTKPGQSRTLNLSFPPEYHVAQLAGKPVRFEVQVKELKKKALPALNNEFSKKMGFDTVDALKAAILEDAKKNEEARIKEDFKNRLLKELAKQNPVDVPKSMLESQKSFLIQDMRERMRGMGMTEANFDDYSSKWDSDFTETATFIVQSSYLINAIAAKESLSASQEDMEKKIQSYVDQTGMDPAKVRSIYNNEEARSRLNHIITEEKVVEFLTGKAKVIEVKKADLKD